MSAINPRSSTQESYLALGRGSGDFFLGAEPEVMYCVWSGGGAIPAISRDAVPISGLSPNAFEDASRLGDVFPTRRALTMPLPMPRSNNG